MRPWRWALSMSAQVKPCSSRCRLEDGRPIRRANSEAYHAFSGCMSVAARIAGRVLGDSAALFAWSLIIYALCVNIN
jgi:hypothetical protein